MIADNQGFPQLNTPIAQPGSLLITQPWYQLIIALWNRTGSGQNVVGQAVYSGKIDQFAGPASKIPQGWLVADGSEVSRTTYKSLFQAIGTTWGAGDGNQTFNLPDLRDKVLIGAGNLYAVGATGGSATQALTVGNLPAHNHAVTDPGHTHTLTDPGHHHTDGTPNGTADVASGANKTSAVAGTTGNSTTGITMASATTGVTTQNTGSGDPVDILPPYAAVTVIIKT